MEKKQTDVEKINHELEEKKYEANVKRMIRERIGSRKFFSKFVLSHEQNQSAHPTVDTRSSIYINQLVKVIAGESAHYFVDDGIVENEWILCLRFQEEDENGEKFFANYLTDISFFPGENFAHVIVLPVYQNEHACKILNVRDIRCEIFDQKWRREHLLLNENEYQRTKFIELFKGRHNMTEN
jgi:hypothetical protein